MKKPRRILMQHQSKWHHWLRALAVSLLAQGCSSQSSPVDGGTDVSIDVPGARGPTPLVVSVAQPVPRTTTWSVNYWRWMPDYGDAVTGTAELIKALKPAFLRVGGYNNDVNAANPFDNAAFDKAVTYARAIGAEPIIQVPLLADASGQPPTAATAAAMVSYANVTKGYGIKYFSIGNEPDLYATQGLPLNGSLPALPGYTPAAYCAAVLSYVAAMKAVDPTIRIVGPDLSWKYQPGSGENDWLTPILTACGSAFDVIAIHRYPFAAANAKLSFAATDATAYRSIMGRVRGILEATGNGEKPLALTEMNIAYDKTWCTLDASPGTVGAALWLADSLGTAMELGLLTSAIWAIGDPDDWAQGLVGPAPEFVPRPAYHAYGLYADHFGPTLVEVTSAPSGLSAHASRNATGDATQVIVINWNRSAASVPVEVSGLPAPPPTVTFVLPAASMAALEIADDGLATAWVYGEAERRAGVGPQPLLAGAAVSHDAGAATDGGAGKAVGHGCGVSPDAASIATAEAGSSTTCNRAALDIAGRLSISGSYVTANGLHGYGGAWAWKGSASQATICATPQCTTTTPLGSWHSMRLAVRRSAPSPSLAHLPCRRRPFASPAASPETRPTTPWPALA